MSNINVEILLKYIHTKGREYLGIIEGKQMHVMDK